MASDLVSVGERCPHLSTINLQNCEVASRAVCCFLQVRGASLRCLYLSLDSQISSLLSQLVSGSCPELRLLEVTKPIKNQIMAVQLPAEGLQTSCPKLEVLRLLNLTFSLKSKPPSCPEGPGFSQLQELCLATSICSHVTDDVCKRLLRDCTQLRVLDLRGCYLLTPQGISEIPCPDVERLYLGIYCSTNRSHSYTGCSFITRRWGHSLMELDLTAQHFSESDLSQALGVLSRSGGNDMLQSLSLTGTKVTVAAVREVLAGCRALTHLDITSCRNIPRGLKCVYRGQDNIRQCLKTFSTKIVEQSGQ
ncbi:F-box LRR-repeat protein 6 [Pristimantis euphronides]